MTVERGRLFQLGDYEWGRGVRLEVENPPGEVRLFASAGMCREIAAHLYRRLCVTVESREVVSFYVEGE